MKNKKLVLFGILAVGGVVATAVLSSWGSFRAAEKLKEVKPVGKVETVKTVWKYYVPAGLALGITIVSDICVYRIGMKELAAVSGALCYATANRDAFEKKVKKVLGDQKVNEIKREVNQEMDQRTDFSKLEGVLDIQETGYGDTLCRFSCDYFNVWIRSDPSEVIRAIENMKTLWHQGAYISFIEFLDDLHIHLKPEMERLFEEWGWPNCSEGCCPGWSSESEIEVYTEMCTGYPGVNEDVFLIDLCTPPFECYMEY